MWPRDILIRLGATRRYDFLLLPSVAGGGRLEPGGLKNRRGRKRRMRNELSSALRGFLLYIIHDRARARARTYLPTYVNYVLRRELCKLLTPGLTTSKGEKERGVGGRERGWVRLNQSAAMPKADFRVIEGIGAGRRVVLLELAATIING